MIDEPSHAASAEALTVVRYTFLILGSCSSATMVVAILVMLAGASRANGSTEYSNASEASSSTATCGADTCGAGSLPVWRGPFVTGLGRVGASGGVIRMTGARGGSATWAGGAAVSQYCCWAAREGSGVGSGVDVGTSVGRSVGRVVGGSVGTAVGDTG